MFTRVPRITTAQPNTRAPNCSRTSLAPSATPAWRARFRSSKPAMAAASSSAAATKPLSKAVTNFDMSEQQANPWEMVSNEAIAAKVRKGEIKLFDLERQLGDFARAVQVRRLVVEETTQTTLQDLPNEHYDYSQVHGQCAENVIGYVPLPVGVAGPLLVDGEEFMVPLATTEGALIASTTRGCKAITVSGGALTEVLNDGISRAPVVEVDSARTAAAIARHLVEDMDDIAAVFNSTSRFARMQTVKPIVVGRHIFLRFKSSTGDAMGMNMVSKGVDAVLNHLLARYPEMRVLALSGNVCTDKKPSAVNWIEGRGKSVVVEAIIRGDVVRNVLKTNVASMCRLNYSKNLVGSAVAGSVGGFNAHASNIVTACFLATGQDPAQNVESSNCITMLEPTNGGEDLYAAVTMPSLEVGTVGGGTGLPGQRACLDLLGVHGANLVTPGDNAKKLARIIGATVLAGELSLMAALSSGHLISTHLRLNRKPTSS